MRLLKLSNRLCVRFFFFSCLLLWALLAWKIGQANAVESLWVAREKIVGAEPHTVIERVNLGRGLLFGLPVFILGGCFSLASTKLYAAALSYFTGEGMDTTF